MAKVDLLQDEDAAAGVSSTDKSGKKTTAKAFKETTTGVTSTTSTTGVTSTTTPSSNTNYCHLSEVKTPTDLQWNNTL